MSNEKRRIRKKGRKPSSISIEDDEHGRRLVIKASDGKIVEQPTVKMVAERRKWKFRYPSLDKSKQRGF